MRNHVIMALDRVRSDMVSNPSYGAMTASEAPPPDFSCLMAAINELVVAKRHSIYADRWHTGMHGELYIYFDHVLPGFPSRCLEIGFIPMRDQPQVRKHVTSWDLDGTWVMESFTGDARPLVEVVAEWAGLMHVTQALEAKDDPDGGRG